MNYYSNRRRSKRAYSRPCSFYFLMMLISFTFIALDPSDANLYSEFNNGLDLISNLAENRVKAETSSAVDEIYEKSEKLLRNRFANDFDEEDDADKLQRIPEIEKLMDVIAPYYVLTQKNYPRMGRHLHQRDAEQWQQGGEEDATAKSSRKERNLVDKGSLPFGSISPRDYFLRSDGKWPNGGVTSALPFSSARQSQMYESIQKLLNRNAGCSNARKKRKRNRKVRRMQKRYDVPPSTLDAKSLLNSAPSLYPEVVAKAPDLTAINKVPKLDMNVPIIPAGFDTNGYSAALNIANSLKMTSPVANVGPMPSLEQIKDLENLLSPNKPRQTNADAYQQSPQPQNCPQSELTANISSILDQVLVELSAIREAKVGNFTPDGSPCNVTGIWNSDIAGVRFDISLPKESTVDANPLVVQLQKPRVRRRDPIIDPSWNCTGSMMKLEGGPLALIAKKNSENTLATFSGFCMTCGRCDIIFGSWTFVTPCKNCMNVTLAIQSKRDILRRDYVEENKAKNKKGKRNSNGGPQNPEEACLDRSDGSSKKRVREVAKNYYADGFDPETFYEYF